MTEMVQRAREAKEAGADMIEVIPPFDVRPYKRLGNRPDVTYQFFKELAQEVDMPISILNTTKGTG